MMNPVIHPIASIRPVGRDIQVTTDASQPGSCTIHFTAPAGYYRLSAVVDASEFDWESLYFPLTLFKNKGQRSGPWDFDFRNQNSPLVPAYRIARDDQPLGHWFFQRVSLQDMENKVFRGNCVVHLASDGRHTLTLESCHPQPLPWLQTTLAPATDQQPADDWVDRIAQKHEHENACASNAMSCWNDPDFWQQVRRRLDSANPQGLSHLQPLLEVTLNAAMEGERPGRSSLLPLIFKARLENDSTALTRAAMLVDELLNLPHLGNPNPQGYGHNGDMLAAEQMLNLSLALTLLKNELSDATKQAIIQKVAKHAQIFVDTALVNDDYWGGSVLQDHGWRSYMLFATALLLLPDAHLKHRHPLAFALGRVRNSVAAMPRDGVVPWSSYGYLNLYLDAAAQLRQTLLAASGIDLYDLGPWHEIIDYLHRVTDDTGRFMIVRTPNQDEPPLIGGLAFCLHMAEKYEDGKAIQLARCIAQRPAPEKYYCSPQAISHRHTPIIALTESWPAIKAIPLRDQTNDQPRMDYFADSGLVRHHDPQTQLTLTLRCAPFAGWHAFEHAKGPCDRMHIVPDDGHFAILHKNQSLLASTEHGYRLRSASRSCMLIDGKGQYGSVDYPMSLPSYQYPGQHIRHVSSDRIELDLTLAYDKAQGVLAYTRRFLFLPDHVIHCIDTVALAKPARLDWLFHSRDEHGLHLDKLRFNVGSPARLTLEPVDIQLTPDVQLAATIVPTEVLWTYDSCTSWSPVSAVQYSTQGAVSTAHVVFALQYLP